MGREEWQQQPLAPEDYDWLLKTLAETPAFDKRSVVQTIAPKFGLYAVGKDAAIVQEGELGHEIFLLYQGTVAVSRAEKELSRLGPGNFFGEMSLLANKGRRAATVKALERCRFFVLLGSDFMTLLALNPDLRSFLVKVAGARKEGLAGGGPTPPTSPG